MNKSFPIALLASFLLAACAETPKDVPIEDRSGEAVRTDGAAAGGSPGAAGAGAGTAGAGAAGAGTEAAPVVTTTPLPPSGEQLRGLGGESIATAQEGASGKNPLKDPDSLLSKRVVYFDFDSAAIRGEYTGLIEAHAAYLKENKEAKVILQGHTDERGSREYNIALGQRRAESVRKSLILLGVPDARIEAVSMGEEKPIAEGHDEASWSQNRRAEIHYQGE